MPAAAQLYINDRIPEHFRGVLIQALRAESNGQKVVAQASTRAPAAAAAAPHQQELTEIAKQLDNPVASLWSLTFQYNHVFLDGELSDETRNQDVLNFQPLIPLRLTEKWNIINRPVFPFLFNTPTFDPTTGFEHNAGFGDLVFASMLAPNKGKGVVWGIGPTFTFPTASDDALGQEKYQVGPAAIVAYLGEQFLAGVLWQHWWSFADAGNGGQPATSQSNIIYALSYYLPDHWQIGLSPNILVDWKADGDNKLTLPVGLSIGKTTRLGRLPVKFTVAAYYAVAHPEDFGQRWILRVQATPVIPSLIKGPLFR